MSSISLLTDAIALEPDLKTVIAEAATVRNELGHNSVSSYERLKARIIPLVGLQARNPELQTHEHYESVIRVVSALLPTDEETED